MSQVRPVGIDLGTTYSAMAWINAQGQSELIPSAEGDLLTPTVVLFDDDAVLVGKEAKKVGVYEADRFAECAKRDMGAPFYSKTICGRRLPPEVIQAFVLKKLRADLVTRVGSDVRAVITVPAFFDEPRRKATVDAAVMAGLEVLDIVNEPTAAALAFGEHLGYLKPGAGPQEKLYILVYDLGGGTFDVTLIELNSGNLRTLATDGDVRLGGRDWDECLAAKVATEFQKLYGEDPREDRVAQQRLLAAAEEAKHTLTVRQNATLKFAHNGHSHECKITREQFEEETLHLLERTAYVTRQLLTAAGMEWKDLHRVLLVGGSTRMPMVASMLKDRTGILPDHSVNPDEAVARGAALYAQYLLDAHHGEKRTTFQVTNVNSHSLGIEGVDPRTNRKCNNIIIPRNSPLPVKKTEKFATKSLGQKSVVVKVLEGESPDPNECTPIGRAAIRDLPADLPAGTKIIVTYEYGTNGRVQVRAEVVGTKKEVTLELEREGALSNDLVGQWGRIVSAGGGMKSFETLLGPSGAKPTSGFRPAGKSTPAATAPKSAASVEASASTATAAATKPAPVAAAPVAAAPAKVAPLMPSPVMPAPVAPQPVAAAHPAPMATAAPSSHAAPAAIQPLAAPAPTPVAATAPKMPAGVAPVAAQPTPAIQSSGRFSQPHVAESPAGSGSGTPRPWWIGPAAVGLGLIILAVAVAYFFQQ